MAATIKIKNSSTASAVPTSSDLVQGELAVNVTDKRLFTENASGTVVELGTNPSTLTVTSGATIQGLTVGKGAGAVSTNTAVGASALAAVTSAANQTAFGYQALLSNQTGGGNSAFGSIAGYSATGGSNTFLGTSAGYYTTSGTNNTYVGNSSGPNTATSTGSYNTSLGAQALQANTTASNNTAIGYQAGYSNTTAINITAVGYQAGYSHTTAGDATFIGRRAGYVSTGAACTFIGESSGVAATTGIANTFVGASSGYLVTTGSKNVILGSYSGNQGGLDIRTSSNYIVLSDGDGNPRAYCSTGGTWFINNSVGGGEVLLMQNSNATPYGMYMGFSAAAPNNSSNYFLYCTDNAAQRITLRSNGGLANYQANNANLSDRREKTNFAPAKNYLDVICSIPVQTFNYIDQNLEEDDGLTLGVVAQDVQAVAPELVMESDWGTKEQPKMRLAIYQTDLQYALMKALQELKTIVDAQAAEIAALKGQA